MIFLHCSNEQEKHWMDAVFSECWWPEAVCKCIFNFNTQHWPQCCILRESGTCWSKNVLSYFISPSYAFFFFTMSWFKFLTTDYIFQKKDHIKYFHNCANSPHAFDKIIRCWHMKVSNAQGLQVQAHGEWEPKIIVFAMLKCDRTQKCNEQWVRPHKKTFLALSQIQYV